MTPRPKSPGQGSLGAPATPLPASDGDTVWWVCHTRPRCEKKFAELCTVEGWTHFLPLTRSIRRYQGRKREHLKPLFPGYVFARIHRDHKPRAFNRDHLVRMLGVRRETIFLDQMEQIRLVLSAGVDVVVQPALAKGHRVRVISGPFMGLHGIVESRFKADSIVIQIDDIGQGVRVKIDPDLLERQT